MMIRKIYKSNLSQVWKQTLKINNRCFFSVHNYMKTYTSDQITRVHGRVRIDENSQIFEDSNALQSFIDKENNLFESHSKKWEKRMQYYMDRVNERRDQRVHSASEIYNGYQYYTTVAWHQGRQYSQIWRKALNNPNKSQLVLDIMKYAQIRNYYKTVELTRTVFSSKSKYIGFGVDLHNNEEVSFMIKDIKNDQIVGVKGWENNRLKGVDNLIFHEEKGVFFTKVINRRPAELWYQDIATGTSKLIFTQKEGQFYLDISMAKDGKHLIVSSNSKQSTKIWTINTQKLDRSNSFEIKPFKQSKKDQKFWLNHNGTNFVLCKQSEVVLISENNIKDEIPIFKADTQKFETITDMDIFSNHIVVYLKRMLSPAIKVIELKSEGNIEWEVQIPFQIGTVTPGANQMLNSSTFMYYINNIFVYDQGYEVNLSSKETYVKDQFKMTGPKFNPNNYKITLHQVPASDGELIPLTTIVPKKNLNTRSKMILHVYGHYGLAYDISFNNTYWAALENGWSLAYAHVRGGNQKGKNWHISAIKGQKYKNWFDLEDCVSYLIKNEFTHPNILILSSHSAGSVSIWNSINRAPHLYKAVIMSYPFLDILGSLLDSQKPLSQSDYAEFGNPNQSLKQYNEIESISPYDNIHQNKPYPFVYIVAGTNDYRCPLPQIATFAKRFRYFRNWNAEKQRFQDIGQKGLLIKINEGSHEGIADLHEQLKDGCYLLGCLDYLIEEGSNDVKIKE